MPIKRAKSYAPALFCDPEPLEGPACALAMQGTGFELFYSHPHGSLYTGDSLEFLKSFPADSVDLIFADPPYNINKAEWDNFESQEHYIEWSLQWLEPAARLLKPTGSLYICGFSEILADIKHPASRFFKGCKWLIWHYKTKPIWATTGVGRTRAFSICGKPSSFNSTLILSESPMGITP